MQKKHLAEKVLWHSYFTYIHKAVSDLHLAVRHLATSDLFNSNISLNELPVDCTVLLHRVLYIRKPYYLSNANQ